MDTSYRPVLLRTERIDERGVSLAASDIRFSARNHLDFVRFRAEVQTGGISRRMISMRWRLETAIFFKSKVDSTAGYVCISVLFDRETLCTQ